MRSPPATIPGGLPGKDVGSPDEAGSSQQPEQDCIANGWLVHGFFERGAGCSCPYFPTSHSLDQAFACLIQSRKQSLLRKYNVGYLHAWQANEKATPRVAFCKHETGLEGQRRFQTYGGFAGAR